MTDDVVERGNVRVEGSIDATGREPSIFSETGTTEDLVESDGSGEETTQLVPDSVDESELSNLQVEIIKQAALHREASSRELAEHHVDASDAYIRRTVSNHWPERSLGYGATRDDADEADAGWVDIVDVDIDTLDTLGVEYEVRKQVRVLEGEP